MKKQVALALAAVMSLSVAGTALAAPANPFVDVPANHWAYDALKELQKDGVVSGYGDGTFRGDRTLTRYEMAAMISKITNVEDKSAPLIKRLQTEFATELNSLGFKVDSLEKNASTVKFTGDARIRYQQGMAISDEAARLSDDSANSSRMQERIRLNVESKVSDNINLYGRLKIENTSNNYDPVGVLENKTSATDRLYFDRAEFNWTNKDFSLSAGRLIPTLGQGLIWDGSSADGLMASYDLGRLSLAGGILDLNANNGFGSATNAAVANLGLKVTDDVNVSVAYLDAMNPQDSKTTLGIDEGYAFKQLAIGANAKLGKDFRLTGEHVRNSDAPDDSEKNGVWARLQWKEIDNNKPGSFSLYVDYMKLGNWAIDSKGFGHTLNVAGGNGIDGDGAKGYGVGLEYVVAKNINVELNGYDLKSHDGSQKYKKSYNFATNFHF